MGMISHDFYKVHERIMLKDGSYLAPGEFCFILWGNPSRWFKARLVKVFPGTSDLGNYEILKTGKIVARGRYMVKRLE